MSMKLAIFIVIGCLVKRPVAALEQDAKDTKLARHVFTRLQIKGRLHLAGYGAYTGLAASEQSKIRPVLV